MKRVWETCLPYPEILRGEATEETFIANLGAVWEKLELGKQIIVPDKYLSPDEMLRRTYYTSELKRILTSISKRLRGDEKAQSVYHLEVGYGGGKTHTLVLLYHMAKNGLTANIGDGKTVEFPRARVVVIDGQLPDATGYRFPDGTHVRTLWGMIFKQLGVYEKLKDYDDWDNMPGVDTYRDVLKGEPTLILMDELVRYMDKVPKKLWRKIATFVGDLLRAVHETIGAAIVITTPLGEEPYEEAARYLRSEIGRHTMPIVVTKAEEAGEVRKRALFERVEVDEDTLLEYQSLYSQLKDRLGDRLASLGTIDVLKERYPFHPLVDDVLYKLKESPSFQAVRDELRFLAGLIYGIFKTKPEDCHIISIADTDLEDSYVRGGIAKVTTERIDVLIAEDLEVLSRIEDPDLRKLARRAHAAIVLNSLVAIPGRHGISREELVFSVIRPGILYESVELAVEEILKRCNVGVRDNRYVFGTISLEKLINMYIKRVEKDEKKIWIRVENALRDYLERRRELRTGKVFTRSSVITWPAATNQVADDKEVKLVLLDYSQRAASSAEEALSMAKDFIERYGHEFRRYRNTIFVLVASRDLVENLFETAKRLVALECILEEREQIRGKYGEDLIKRVEVEKKRLEKDIGPLALQAYRYLVYPGCKKPIELGLDTRRTREILRLVEERLKEVGKIMPEGMNTEYFISCYWPKEKPSCSVDELISGVYERPEAPLIPNEPTIMGIIKDAVKEGRLVFVYRNDVYWKREPLHLHREGTLWLAEEARRSLRVELSIEAEPVEVADMGLIAPKPGSYSYTLGQEVDIKARSDEEWKFKYWLVDGRPIEESTLTLTMDRHYKVKAIYEKEVPEGPPPPLITINIQVEPPDAGKVTPMFGQVNVRRGATISLTAEPEEGWSFSCWKYDGEVVGTDSSIRLKVDRPGSIIAVMRKEVVERTINLGELPFNELPRAISPHMDELVRRLDMTLTSGARDLLPLVRHIASLTKVAEKKTISISSKGENVGGMDMVEVTGKTISTEALRNFMTQLITYLGETRLSIMVELKQPKPLGELVGDDFLSSLKERRGRVKISMIVRGRGAEATRS